MHIEFDKWNYFVSAEQILGNFGVVCLCFVNMVTVSFVQKLDSSLFSIWMHYASNTVMAILSNTIVFLILLPRDFHGSNEIFFVVAVGFIKEVHLPL